jgi:hypothetical protein
MTLAILGLLLLTACGSEASRSETTAPAASPSAAATADLLTTRRAVTVIDDGDGVELCLGVVMASMPPQCDGPRLVGWDWSEHRGDFERSRAIRWGAFQVTGTFADGAMTPTEAVAMADLDEQPAYDDLRDFTSPCPEPDGGWRVVDPALATDGAMQRTLRVAARLDGYAEAWLDRSIHPLDGQEAEEAEMAMNDPTRLVVNVRVTGDVDSAEATLRETWGGALCVSKAEHTDAELGRIQRAMMRLPGMLTSDRGEDRVNVTVAYDDGSLQDDVDEKYGAGTVRVESALVPVEDEAS